MKHTVFLLCIVVLVISGCGTMPNVIDFDDLSTMTTAMGVPVNVGDSFTVGATLIEQSTGVQILVLPFQWMNGQWTDDGYVEIVQGTMSGGSGNEVHFNNACLGIVTPQDAAIRKLSVKFGDHGGNINFFENGTLHNYRDHDQIPSPTPSGLIVTVTGSLPTAVLDLEGQMDKFFYAFPVPAGFPVLEYSVVIGGGQELWIDDIIIEQ